MSAEQNKAIVASFWQAFSTAKYDQALDHLDDQEFTWWIAGDKANFPLAGNRNKAEFAELLYGVADSCEDGITMTPSAWTVEGDRVAMEAESYAVVNGKVYNNLYHFLIVVKNGKIRQVKEYLDTTHASAVLC
ncbi:ketosteroid isomerase-like protein [Spongiibacter sp. IMCC21906]|jgi:ketosteroid isomerase-like protein|uniref:nuclear transport factor 2 family protein n=1 Tax=Spongiibacter sp. IMCC21906 TaxID=1620392 RepID=UPI00062DD283|nr:nuclear transport factor 2 family protein [Spongiibacter sp. IMCC21906]AKH69302.1 ketosteroid isomerase-like protein [Spongiibacter sp. IMCC21906]